MDQYRNTVPGALAIMHSIGSQVEDFEERGGHDQVGIGPEMNVVSERLAEAGLPGDREVAILTATADIIINQSPSLRKTIYAG